MRGLSRGRGARAHAPSGPAHRAARAARVRSPAPPGAGRGRELHRSRARRRGRPRPASPRRLGALAPARLSTVDRPARRPRIVEHDQPTLREAGHAASTRAFPSSAVTRARSRRRRRPAAQGRPRRRAGRASLRGSKPARARPPPDLLLDFPGDAHALRDERARRRERVLEDRSRRSRDRRAESALEPSFLRQSGVGAGDQVARAEHAPSTGSVSGATSDMPNGSPTRPVPGPTACHRRKNRRLGCGAS